MKTMEGSIMQNEWLAHQLRRAKTNGVISERCILTPDVAAELLERNPDNRPLKEAALGKMIQDIQSGHWVFNGEPIIIADTGELNDGQHRCVAVVKTGMSIETMMTFGPPRQSRLTVDRGVAKRPGDFLGMQHIKNGQTVAAAARIACQYDTIKNIVHDTRLEPTTQEIIEYVVANPRLVEIVSAFYSTTATRAISSRSVCAAMHYIFERINKDDAEKFMTDVTTGHMIDAKSPAGLLRTRMMDKTQRLRRSEMCELFARAWNAYRDRRPFAKLLLMGNFPELS